MLLEGEDSIWSIVALRAKKFFTSAVPINVMLIVSFESAFDVAISGVKRKWHHHQRLLPFVFGRNVGRRSLPAKSRGL